MKKIVLDTNAYIHYLSGDQNVLKTIAKADIVYMSIFVMGELYAGFKGGTRESRNREYLERFLLKPTVRILDATKETADIFGMLKSALKKAGTPIPINDIWIASHAFETGAVMVTHDRHFDKIQGLRLW